MDHDSSAARRRPTQPLSPTHVPSMSLDTGTSFNDHRPSTGIRRRPSLSAMAALFTPSSSRASHNNSWKDASKPHRRALTNLTRPSTALPMEEQRLRVRRPSMSLAEFGKGLFGHRTRDETPDGTGLEATEPLRSVRDRLMQRIKRPFRKDCTFSTGEMDAALEGDSFYSFSTTSNSYPLSRTRRYDYYHGGAAARAAAAAQNEASSSSLFRRDLSRLRQPQNDSESGIGISLHDKDDSIDVESIMIRIDPAAFLPEEIFAYCLSFLDSSSIIDAELVSHRWRETANSRSMWRQVFTTEFGKCVATNPRLPLSGGLGYGSQRPDQEWKKMWKARKALEQRWTDGHAAAIYLEGHTDTVYCVQFDENKIITGSRDRTLRVWDIKTLQCIKVLGTPKDSSNSHPTAPLTPPTRGRVPWTSIISLPPRIPLHPVRHEPELTHQGSILCLQFDSEILVTGSSDTTVIVWSIASDYTPIKRLRQHTAGVLDVCFDSQYIVSCSKDTTICLWNRHSGDLIRQINGHRGPVNAVQLRDESIVSASGDGIAKLWHIPSGHCLKEFSSRDRGLACVEFSPDCRYIYAGGNDQSIYQFDAATRECVREFKGHRNLVRSLHLDHANKRIVSGSYDHSIQVYDTRSGEMMCEFAGWTTSWMLSAKTDYRRIVATSQDRRVVVVDFGMGVRDVDLLRSCDNLSSDAEMEAAI